MMKHGDLGLWIRVKYRESLDTMHGWFSEVLSDESSVALFKDEGVDSGQELPLAEEIPPVATRSCYASCRPRGARRMFLVMMPSFFARRFGHASDDSAIPVANETSYLNGLRGIASVIVALQHNIDDYDFLYHGWGERDEDRHFMQLPFIRLIHSGLFSVGAFFVISGFALTYGPLKKAHDGRSAATISSLPSSLFRRPIRLFLPVIPVLVPTAALVHFGAFYKNDSREPMEPQASGFWGQLNFLWTTVVTIITASSPYTIMPQGWTLATEYKGSLLVFLCCMAFARTSVPLRMTFVLLLLVFEFHRGLWEPSLFLTGMLLADARHARKKLPELTGTPRRAATVASWLLLGLALFLGGWPRKGDGYAALGYSLFAWVPTGPLSADWFFPCVSAMALVTALESLPVIQRALNAGWVLYLGEISYGLYLVHWTAGKCFLTWGLKYRLLDAGYSLNAAWTISFFITAVLSLWLADVHWRLVDRKSVRFAHWLSRICGV